MAFEITALVFSILALLTAAYALWMIIFKPFKLMVSNTIPTLSMYKITPDMSGDEEKKTWWIPSFDMGITFANEGRGMGKVLDMRIVAVLEKGKSKKEYEYYPKWVVDYSKFTEFHTDRFKWIDTATKGKWYPLTLAGQQSESVHVVFEADRWDEKQGGNMNYYLQVLDSKNKKWIENGKYHLIIALSIFEDKSTRTGSGSEVAKYRKLKRDVKDK